VPSGLLWTVLLVLVPLAGDEPTPRTETLRGEVVELTEALNSTGIVADREPISRQVVLRTAEGETIPLLSDEGSRALFLDERLRGRPVEIQARRFPGLPYVQVTALRVEDEGTLRTPEYYCDVCTIHVRFPQVCPCCQGSMELRMKPEAR
jgi:hypothetical protein